MKKLILILSLFIATLPLFAFEFNDDLVIQVGFGIGFTNYLPDLARFSGDTFELDSNVTFSNRFNLWFGNKIEKNEKIDESYLEPIDESYTEPVELGEAIEPIAVSEQQEETVPPKKIVRYTNRNTRSSNKKHLSYKQKEKQIEQIEQIEPLPIVEEKTNPHITEIRIKPNTKPQYTPGLLLELGFGYRSGTKNLRGDTYTPFIDGPFLSIGFGNRLFFYNNTELDINIWGRIGIINFTRPSLLSSVEFVRLYQYNNKMMGWKVSLETYMVLLKCHIGYVVRF